MDIGKPRGIDIKEKKMTLPLIYALQSTDKATKKRIINGIKKRSTDDHFVKEVIQFVNESNGLKYAEKIMYNYRDEALEILRTFPENEARQSLEELVLFVTERKK